MITAELRADYAYALRSLFHCFSVRFTVNTSATNMEGGPLRELEALLASLYLFICLFINLFTVEASLMAFILAHLPMRRISVIKPADFSLISSFSISILNYVGERWISTVAPEIAYKARFIGEYCTGYLRPEHWLCCICSCY